MTQTEKNKIALLVNLIVINQGRVDYAIAKNMDARPHMIEHDKAARTLNTILNQTASILYFK